MVDVIALQADFESELKEMQNLQKDMKRLAESRQQLIEQQSECEIVKKEVDLLEESAKVFKLIGNVLVKQSTKECKTNVDKRIEFISKEIKKVEDSMKENEVAQINKKNKIMKFQDSFMKLKQGMAAAQQQNK